MLEVVATTPSRPLGACIVVDMMFRSRFLKCRLWPHGRGNARVATNFYTLNQENFPTRWGAFQGVPIPSTTRYPKETHNLLCKISFGGPFQAVESKVQRTAGDGSLPAVPGYN